MSNNKNYIETYKKKYLQLKRKMLIYNPKTDWKFLKKAYDFGRDVHAEQLRNSGEPYFEHCHQVSMILSEFKMDTTAVVSGILHDVIEDVGIKVQDLEEEFNSEVALIVDGVTKIGGLKFESFEQKQAENFRKMLLSMTKDLRVILIKFADRLHNMRTLHYLHKSKRKRIALETIDVYAPLAYRFGMAKVKMELEDLAFKHLEPKIYKKLEQQVAQDRNAREKYVKSLAPIIRRHLRHEKIKATITGRPKNLYSVYMKMKKQNLSFESIFDLHGLRILVPKKEDCYVALGIIHSLFTSIQERLKDYISNPKINGYQSIHTTVVGPKERMVEIQIRTEKMHRQAEDGIAAHWLYKEEKSHGNELDVHLSWIRQLLEQPALYYDEPKEFMQTLKIDLYQDEVFVFTPKGHVISLPAGATPLDFAFDIHTDVGLHCIAAKSNGKIIPLSSKLESGSTVEIIKSDSQTPSRDWLKHSVTSKAHSTIQKWLRESQNEQSIDLGDEMLHKQLKKLRVKYTKELLIDAAQALSFEDLNDLYASVGRGETSIQSVINKMVPTGQEMEQERESFLGKFLRRSRSAAGITVQGLDNLMMKFGKCCNPVPGDKIVGFITKGKGITIHRQSCINVNMKLDQADKMIEVEWDVEPGKQFFSHIKVVANDRKSLLSDITNVIASSDVNIIDAHITAADGIANNSFIFEVANLRQLKDVIKKIGNISGIIEVQRIGDNSEVMAN